MTSDLLAELYESAANDLKNRDHGNSQFGAGPETWKALHTATHDLVTAPLVEGVRRRVGVRQVQWWQADKETVIKTLRDLAEGGEYLTSLRDASAEHRIATATRILQKAFGRPASSHAALETIAAEAAHELRVLRAENQRLREAGTRR